MNKYCGYQIIASSGVVLTASRPVVLYGVHIPISGTVVEIHDDSGTSGDPIINITSTDTNELCLFKGGLTCPKGAYFNIDASVTVLYKAV